MTINFLHGAVMMACVTAAVFFLRFFRDTGDRLFVWFAVAFGLLGIERIAVAALGGADNAEMVPTVYLLRCLAFLLIIGAVVGKNRP